MLPINPIKYLKKSTKGGLVVGQTSELLSMIQSAGTSAGYSGWPSSAYTSLFCLSLSVGRSASEGSSSLLLKPELSPMWDPRACVVPCAPVQGSWSTLPGVVWQKPTSGSYSYFYFSLLFLLMTHVVFFQDFVTIPVSFTGGWVFTAPSYKLGTWNTRKRRVIFIQLLRYWWIKQSAIWYPQNQWQNWSVNFQISSFAFSLLDNSSPLRKLLLLINS